MKRIDNKIFIFFSEVIFFYGAIGLAYHLGIISEYLTFLLMSFLSLIFALYYGINGIAVAAIGTIAIVSLVTKSEVLVFLSWHYMEACFFVSGLVLTGIARATIEQKVTRTGLANEVMQQRMDRLLVEVSEKDRGLQDVLEQVLSEVESPKILYHAMRKIENIDSYEEFLNEILYVLYTYCHVEKSAIYKPGEKGRLKRVVSFGATSLPEEMEWKSEEMPEIVRVMLQEREIIIPKKAGHRLIMAIPILSVSDELIYVLIIEEIRFINLSEKLIGLLKLMAFWTRYLLEKRLYREKLKPLSAFNSIIVYQPSIARKVLDDNISCHKKHGLPFALLRIEGPIDEEGMGIIASALRIYDDLFMLDEKKVIVFLSMTDEKNLTGIIDRLKAVAQQYRIESADKTGFE